MSKESRLKKQLEKQLKSAEKNVRFVSTVPIDEKYVRMTTKPELRKLNISNPDNYKTFCFSWCETHADLKDAWSWNEARQWADQEFIKIKQSMDSNRQNSWNEVEQKSYNGRGGYRKLLNKYQSLDSICEEAQNRWLDLDLISQFDELFRLRLGSERRIWSIRIQHHFYLVWYERYHKICPLDE